MAAAVDEFSMWLGNKLQALNTDESVFGSYITGILDGDETVEEKTEAIQELLTEIIESDISAVCKEIMDMWQKLHPNEPNASTSSEAVDEKLVRLLEAQSLATTVQRQYTADERKIREAILGQYSQMTDEEDENDEEAAGGDDHKSSNSGLERNTNFFSVQQAEKEKRELAKIESQKKKEKDKEDREKQKQLREEKKEKRKTQKGERRR